MLLVSMDPWIEVLTPVAVRAETAKWSEGCGSTTPVTNRPDA